jgi:hypothetical protein
MIDAPLEGGFGEGQLGGVEQPAHDDRAVVAEVAAQLVDVRSIHRRPSSFVDQSNWWFRPGR